MVSFQMHEGKKMSSDHFIINRPTKWIDSKINEFSVSELNKIAFFANKNTNLNFVQNDSLSIKLC